MYDAQGRMRDAMQKKQTRAQPQDSAVSAGRRVQGPTDTFAKSFAVMLARGIVKALGSRSWSDAPKNT